jgi:hypothetical protein
MANKTATDEAAKVTARKETLEAQLRLAPSVTDADPGAAVWDRLFGIDPELGRTWQGIAGVVLIELLIAFLLLGVEMLRKEGPKAVAASAVVPAPMLSDKIEAPTKPKPRLVVADQPKAGSVPDIMADLLKPAKGRGDVKSTSAPRSSKGKKQ